MAGPRNKRQSGGRTAKSNSRKKERRKTEGRVLASAERGRGRPARPLPPKVDATPEQLAQAMFQLPADHQWEYLKQDAPKEYHCADCERLVAYPEVLHNDGRCEGCHAQTS